MCGMQRSWEETVKDFLGGELSQLLPVQLACMPCFQTGSWEAAVAKSLDVRRCYQSSCSRWDRGGTSLVQLVSALPAWVPPPPSHLPWQVAQKIATATLHPSLQGLS